MKVKNNVRKSLALAFAVTNAAPGLAADWSGPYGGLSAGGGFGEQSQQGGILMLPTRGGMSPPTMGSMGSMGSMMSMGSSSMTSSMTTTTTTMVPTSIPTSMPVSCPPGQTFNGASCEPITADGRYRMRGGLVGGGVGYNFQHDRLVYGASLDGSWADISGNGTCGVGGALPHACGGGIRALGTVRGRLGYDLLGPALGPFAGAQIFAAGGLAIANVHAWDGLFGTSGSRTLTGWTAGGGVEALFGAHWSVTLEYLHVDLGQHAIFTAIAPNPERVRTTAELFKLGLSYHFNAVATTPAVIAKY